MGSPTVAADRGGKRLGVQKMRKKRFCIAGEDVKLNITREEYQGITVVDSEKEEGDA